MSATIRNLLPFKQTHEIDPELQPLVDAPRPAPTVEKPVIASREQLDNFRTGKRFTTWAPQLFGLANRAGADTQLVKALLAGNPNLAQTQGPRGKFRWQHEQLSALRKELRAAHAKIGVPTRESGRIERAIALLTSEIDARKTDAGFKRTADLDAFSENFVRSSSPAGLAHGVQKHWLAPANTSLKYAGAELARAAEKTGKAVAIGAAIVLSAPLTVGLTVVGLVVAPFFGVALGLEKAIKHGPKALHSFFSTQFKSGKQTRHAEQAALVARIDDKQGPLDRAYVKERVGELSAQFNVSGWNADARRLFEAAAVAAEKKPERLLKAAEQTAKLAATRMKVQAIAARYVTQVRRSLREKQAQAEGLPVVSAALKVDENADRPVEVNLRRIYASQRFDAHTLGAPLAGPKADA